MEDFSHYKILIVDDDPMFRLMLRQFLENNDFVVVEAVNGQHGVELFETESPNMVLMDAVMPIMDGITACQQIRDQDPDEKCPVLMITAKDDEDFITSAFEAGAADYITKPIQWTVLKQRIKHKLKINQAIVALQESEERFRLLFQKSPLPYQSLDVEGNIVDINVAWLKMLGFERDKVINRAFIEFLAPDEISKFQVNFKQFIVAGSLSDFQFKMLNKDKRIIDIGADGRIAYDTKSKTKHAQCILRDITERNLMEEKLRILASTDPLTNLVNRRAFFEHSELLHNNCIRYQRPFSMMMLDIDHFKKINDQFGHAIGDDVLKLVADVMRTSLREVDILGRIGGEEFAIALPETKLQFAAEIAERIRFSVEKLVIKTPAGIVDIKMSIGVVEMTTDSQTIDDLLKQADALLYHAKQNGRNRVEY